MYVHIYHTVQNSNTDEFDEVLAINQTQNFLLAVLMFVSKFAHQIFQFIKFNCVTVCTIK